MASVCKFLGASIVYVLTGAASAGWYGNIGVTIKTGGGSAPYRFATMATGGSGCVVTGSSYTGATIVDGEFYYQEGSHLGSCEAVVTVRGVVHAFEGPYWRVEFEGYESVYVSTAVNVNSSGHDVYVGGVVYTDSSLTVVHPRLSNIVLTLDWDGGGAGGSGPAEPETWGSAAANGSITEATDVDPYLAEPPTELTEGVTPEFTFGFDIQSLDMPGAPSGSSAWTLSSEYYKNMGSPPGSVKAFVDAIMIGFCVWQGLRIPWRETRKVG